MTKKDSNKYSVSGDEQEVLPNKLGLNTKEDIDNAEFLGFLTAQVSFIQDLSENTKFNLAYLHSYT